MKLTKKQLKRIIREEYTRLQRKGLINESMAQQDILYLGNLLGSYKGTFRDWSEFCVWYDDVIADLLAYPDEFMEDFLYTNGLETCPDSIAELRSILEDPGVQSHSRFSAWATALRSNF